MIRPFTAICVLLAGASGLYLYTEKHRTTVLDQQISKIVQDTQHIRERTAMLRAEWALLNQPDRLQSLSARFLPELHPMAPTQFVQMATLARHLPEVATAPPAAAPLPVPAGTPPDATLLAPIQIMARQMASPPGAAATDPAETDPSGPGGSPSPRPTMQLASSAVVAAPAAAGDAARHLVQRAHASARAGGASRPAPAAATARSTQASRMAAYEGAPMPTLDATAGSSTTAISTTGSAYLHPAPMQAAAWRMTSRAAYAPATHATYSHAAYPAPAAPPIGHSSLGFSHAAMPAPVPLDGD